MRILSGMRPTGELHIGNLLGALDNWVKLQNEGNECFFFIADWHMLTTGYENISKLSQMTKILVREYLSSGLNSEKSVIFVQSAIKAHAELFLLLSMITPLGRLERVPTYKEQLRELSDREITTFGFLGYPVLMSSDILIYDADGVPVGEDQTYHLEFTREIAEHFNSLYGVTFKVPKALFSAVSKLSGTDGRKMSKSYGNVINLDSNPEELKAKILPMPTDPARIHKYDPGTPEKCNVWYYHLAFETPKEKLEYVHYGCTHATIGCIECKKLLIESMQKKLTPIWEKISYYKAHDQEIDDIISEGNKKAAVEAEKTIERVRHALNLSF
uniref:Tryptophan--tRNA ligase n=1 Tax=Mesoaciditoga lauensis TaxID=1495039 RepID=A0A7V3VSS3_9BACT